MHISVGWYGRKKKIKTMKNKKNQKKQVKRVKARLANPRNPTFGAVSTINTAPVAIGNSMSGFATKTVATKDGMRVIGRDFGFTVMSTGTVTNWVIAGGLPTSPFAFTSSVLQNCARMYNRYKPRRLVFHYITSSATSQTGDVMFYLRKNEGSTMPQPTSSTFLNYVLSDSNTVIGPQWTNHTCVFDTSQTTWLSTDYGATSELNSYNQYDLFIYSKTSSANSPGYVIVDYEYEFKEIALNPRAGNLAEISGAKAIWQPFVFNVTINATINVTTIKGTSQTNGIGGTTIAAVSTNQGDVWECILDVTNSTFTNTTSANFAAAAITAGATGTSNATCQPVTLTDGMVVYLVDDGTTGPVMYFTKDAAFAGWNPAMAGKTQNPYAETIRGIWRLVGSTRPLDLAYTQ